jgi:tellurite resistance protein TerC
MPRSRNVLWVIVWVGLSLALGVSVLITQGAGAAAEYYAAYFLEKSLSVDNIFVFVIIFSELQIPREYQRRVLRFGVAGALVFRALVIGAGIALIERFGWVTYPFAVLILFAAWRMLFGAERERDAVQAACNVCGTWIARLCA